MINADKKKEMKNLSEMLLETRNLTKQYGHHKAVDSVNMHIKKGAIYGFIGRNGAGKTTCLKMISGLSKPTCGEIEMFGYKGKDLQKVRSRIGCLIEAPGLYGNMTAYENLNIKCKLFGIKKKSYIEEILRIVGLEDVGKKKTKHFSLGMKQRLGIALALVLICMTIAVTLKNNVISMVIAVCLTMNVMTIVYGLVNNAIQKMGIQNFQIYEYTITGKLSLLPMNPGGKECLAAFGVALAFIVATIVAGSVVFQKRDI